jgi:hypothetical protein
MNERIKQLAEEAVRGIQADFYIPDVFKEKFAELIVRECASIAKLTDDDDGADYSSGRFWAGNDILTHFGVEE